jgi:hypothetical protein
MFYMTTSLIRMRRPQAAQADYVVRHDGRLVGWVWRQEDGSFAILTGTGNRGSVQSLDDVLAEVARLRYGAPS